MTRMALKIADGSNRIDHVGPEAAASGGTIDLGSLASGLRRQRWIFAAWIGLGLLAGGAYLATTPDSYSASASILLTGRSNADLENLSIAQGDNVSEITIENALQVLESQRLANRVADTLALVEDERFLSERSSGLGIVIGQTKGIVKGTLRALIGVVSRPDAASQRAATPEEQAILARDSVVEALQWRAQIYRVGRSSVIGVTFNAQVPELAAELANAYVEAYQADVLQANLAASEATASWLGQRLAELASEVRETSTAVERFRRENGLVESVDGLMTEESVRNLNSEYSIAVAEQARSRALVTAYQAILDQGPEALNGQAARLMPDAEDLQLAGLQQEYDDLRARRADVVETFGADHPEVVRLDTAIATQRSRLFEGIGQAAATARGNLAFATARVEAMREAVGGAIETNADAGQALVELRALEQRAEAASNLHESLLLQSERVAQQGTLPVAHLRVLSLATVPTDPSSPSTTRVLALCLILGLMAALVHSALREWRDRYIRTGADITDWTGQKFLGYLPIIKGLPAVGANGAGTDLIQLGAAEPPPALAAPRAAVRYDLTSIQEPQSLYVETLRRVRLASDLAWTGKGGRIIGVTSLHPGEGKTTVSANLAAVLASGGRETLLVDADLRKADLSRRLGLTSQSGVVSVAINGVPASNTMSAIEGTNVKVIGCEGRHAGDFAYEVLSSPTLHQTLAQARERFNTIVLDLAPLGPVVDTRLLLGIVDQIVLVAEWGRTPRQLVSYTLENEPQLRSKMLGVVLSRVNVKDLQRYSALDIQPGYESYYGGHNAQRS